MYGFVTESGSTYQVINGKLIRDGQNDIIGREGHDPILTILKVTVRPVVGHVAYFLTREIGSFHTSPVEMICKGFNRRSTGAMLPIINDVCRYCGHLVEHNDEDTSASRINGDSKYGYELHHHSCLELYIENHG